MFRRDAERPEAARGPLALGDRLPVVVFGLAELLLSDGLRLEELARQSHGLVRSLDVGDRLGVVRLGTAEIGAVHDEELLAGLADVAGTGEHLDDAPGGRRLNADELLLVELRLAARLDGGDAHAVLGPHGLDDLRGLGPRLGRGVLLGAGVAPSPRERGGGEDEGGRTDAHGPLPRGPPPAGSRWERGAEEL